MAPYFEEYDEIGTGPDAPGPVLLLIDEQPGVGGYGRFLDDPAGDHDSGISAEVDLAASDAAGEPVSDHHRGQPAVTGGPVAVAPTVAGCTDASGTPAPWSGVPLAWCP